MASSPFSSARCSGGKFKMAIVSTLCRILSLSFQDLMTIIESGPGKRTKSSRLNLATCFY